MRAETVYRWRLRDEARSTRTRRHLRVIVHLAEANAVPRLHADVLAAILLVESVERPLAARILERAIQAAGRTSTTCGPLQIANAPLDFRKAATLGYQRLEEAHRAVGVTPTLEDFARAWNGAASRQPGAAFGYATALELALDVVREVEEGTLGAHGLTRVLDAVVTQAQSRATGDDV